MTRRDFLSRLAAFGIAAVGLRFDCPATDGSLAVPRDGRWHHVAWSYDWMYLDGKQCAPGLESLRGERRGDYWSCWVKFKRGTTSKTDAANSIYTPSP
jgi:hypothetical protein